METRKKGAPQPLTRPFLRDFDLGRCCDSVGSAAPEKGREDEFVVPRDGAIFKARREQRRQTFLEGTEESGGGPNAPSEAHGSSVGDSQGNIQVIMIIIYFD